MKQYSSKEILKFLQKHGFEIIKQRGSHVSLFNDFTGKMVIVLFHNKDLKIGTLMSILKKAGLTKNDLN